MKTILIVDDIFENLYLLRVILEKANFEVIEAKDGKVALEKLRKNSVDLIISDILMPVMDGYLLCQACKKDELLKHIPFVFYTSTYTEKSDEDFALKLGASHFLIKPTDPDDIIKLVQELLTVGHSPLKPKEEQFTEKEVLKLYSKRLIRKLEQKNLDLEKEVLERQKFEHKLINENVILDLIANNAPIKKVFDHIINNYESLHPGFFGTISLLEEDGLSLNLISGPKLPESYNLAIKSVVIGEGVGSCGAAAFTKKPVIVSDISKDALWVDYKELALKHHLKSCWSIPILSENDIVLGTFAIYSYSVNTPSLEDIRELNSAVSLAKITIIKFNIMAAVKKSNESYKALVNQASDAIFTYSFDGDIYDFNEATYQMLGYTKKEFLKLKIQDILVGDIIKSTKRYQELLKGKPVMLERQLVCKDGTIIEAEISAKLQNDEKTLAIVRDVTERKKAELALKQAKDYSESLIESLHEGLVVYDTDTNIIKVNPSFCRMSGFSEEELVGQQYPYSFCPPEIIEESKLRHKKALLGDVIPNFESVYMRKDGKRFNVNVMVSYINDSDGNSMAYFGTIIDTTERKKAEIKLIESERNLRQSQRVGNIGSYSIDINTMLWDSSRVLDTILGLTEQDTFVKSVENWVGLVHPEDREEILSLFENNVLKNNEKFDYEYRFIRLDNEEVRWAHGFGELVFDSKGNPIKMIGTVQDITSRKQFELQIKESEKSLIEAQKIAKIGSFNLDLKKQIAKTSAIFNEIIGVDLNAEVSFDLWKTIAHPEDRLLIKNTVKQGVELKQKIDLECRILTKNTKELKWIHGLAEAVLVNGEVTMFLGTIQDVTERKQNELALKAAKEFSDKLIMSMQEGLLIVNLEGQIIMVNDSLCDIFGYSQEELIGLNLPYPFAKTEDLELMLKTKEEVAKGETKSFYLEFIRKNGEKYLVSFLSGNIKNDKGEVIALFATIKDVSEEEKAKRILEDVAKKSILKKKVIMELTALVGSDYHKTLKQITSIAASTLNVARVGIWKFNEERTNLVCENLYNLETGVCESGMVLTRKDNPIYFEALTGNQTISVADAVNNDITKGYAKNYLEPLGISSLLDVFIQGNQGMHGVICFEHIGEKRDWTADDEEFATSIASIVSLMVESSERKTAEKNLVVANAELSNANIELNHLREQLEQENVYLRNELDLVFNYEEMVYGSEVFSNVLTEIERVAPTNATVLLLGESGTGKELLARAIHNTGLRNTKPLIKVNCSAIPRELMESELFGHKKGSFTGAFSDKIGKFELAHEGTLFLDEIGELPLDMQPKILRFLQEGEIEVVGGTELKKLDVRVIAATNRDLKEEIEKKQFREDLYFRLNVFPIKVPALRNRKEDIPLLVEHFVDKFNKSYEKHIKFIPNESMDGLKMYDWPGNIRELENLIERAVILSDSETLMLSPVSESSVLSELAVRTSNLTLNQVQRNHIIKILDQCDWKIDGEHGASKLLDIKPSTLRDRMKKLGINKPAKK
ncbi:MAG: PAS domain S-box protein [Algibacter sp.]|uniref:PAS domain S-box protein n=1 Tax=Algibacter sp. TaxID=1872428 RepID=UPI00329A01AC